MRKRTNDTLDNLIGRRPAPAALALCAFLTVLMVFPCFAVSAAEGAADSAAQYGPPAPPALMAQLASAALPAPSYFPLLPPGADADTLPQWLPVAGNHPLDGEHAGVTRAIIIIHDRTRDAQGALAMLSALAGGDNATLMLMAPQFLLDADIERFKDHLPDGGKMFARWPLAANNGWDDGGDSLAQGAAKGVSSFTAMDLLLIYLADKQFFPDLKDIVIAGHGAGGDFVQRYAAIGQAPDILDGQHMPVRFVVANAASYLYFTASRPKPAKKADLKTMQKDEPRGIGVPDAAACPNYNAYKYGLDQLNPYARRVGVNAIKTRYVTRAVDYLTGADAAQADMFPDTSCAAMMQGADRAARAMDYSMYLNIIFGGDIGKLQNFTVVPKAGNDAAAMFGSRCGMAVLFGEGCN